MAVNSTMNNTDVKSNTTGNFTSPDTTQGSDKLPLHIMTSIAIAFALLVAGLGLWSFAHGRRLEKKERQSQASRLATNTAGSRPEEDIELTGNTQQELRGNVPPPYQPVTPASKAYHSRDLRGDEGHEDIAGAREVMPHSVM